MQPMMRGFRARIGSVFAAMLVVAFAATAWAGDREKMIDHYQKGQRFYQMGKFSEAKAEFQAMLKLQPTGDDAVLIRERAGIDNLIMLWSDPRFRDEIKVILDLSLERSEELRKEVANIQGYVKQLQSEDSREVWKAIYRLTRIGPYAVPELLDHAASNEAPTPNSLSVSARIILRSMGVRATPPLLQALKAATKVQDPAKQAEAERRDLTLKLEICRLVAASCDRRALPDMLALVEKPKLDEMLRSAARAAAEQIVGKNPTPTAEQAYYDTASAYMTDDPRVTVFVPGFERLVWRWKEGPEESYTKKLLYEAPPDYLFGKLVAQQLLLDGFKVAHKNPRLLGLYVANNYVLYNAALGVSTLARATEAERAEAQKYVKALEYVRELNEQLGAEYLYLALERGLKEANVPLVLSSIAGLRAVRDPRPLPGAQVLLAALAHPVRDVRIAAAEAVVWISPDGGLCSSPDAAERAMAGMYALLTTGGKARLLVVTQRRALYENLVPHLEKWAMDSEMSLNASSALMRLHQPLPPIDVVLVDSQLTYGKLEDFLKLLRADIRTQRVPVVITCPAKLADQVKKSLAEYKVEPIGYDDEGKVTPPDMKDALDAALKDYRAGQRNVDEAMLERALTTLSLVPASSKYATGLLVPVLIELLPNRPEAIAAASVEALGRLGDRRGFLPVCRVLLGAKAPQALRVRAGEAAARLATLALSVPPDVLEGLQKLAADPEASLRIPAVRILAKVSIAQQVREEAVVRAAGEKMLK